MIHALLTPEHFVQRFGSDGGDFRFQAGLGGLFQRGKVQVVEQPLVQLGLQFLHPVLALLFLVKRSRLGRRAGGGPGQGAATVHRFGGRSAACSGPGGRRGLRHRSGGGGTAGRPIGLFETRKHLFPQVSRCVAVIGRA